LSDDKKSFYQILEALEALDESLEEIDFDDQINLLEEGKTKVDSYKYIIDKLESHAEYLAKQEAHFAQAKKVTLNNIKRIKEQLLNALAQNNFERYAGNQWIVRRQKGAKKLEVNREPMASDIIKMPDLVEVKYSWNKVKLKDKFDESEEIKEFCTLKQSEHVRFAIKKGDS